MSKINVQMTQPKYIIKPNDGIVICQIQANGDYQPYMNITDIVQNSTKLKKKYNIEWLNDKFWFTAIAKLHKEDTWNEIKGKRIAESKCKRKIYEFYLRLYADILKELMNNDIKMLNHHLDNLEYCANREEKHLKELMK